MSSIVLSGDTSGTVTVSVPAVAGTNTVTIPAVTGTAVIGSAAVSAVGQIPFSTDGTSYTPTAKIVASTAVASTSGTSITFTGIPSWVKRITIMLNGVGTTGTSGYVVKLGTSGGIVTTGYLSGSAYVGASQGSGNSTTQFLLNGGTSKGAGDIINGNVIITNLSGNIWAESHFIGQSNNAYALIGGGSINLGATLTQLQITTSGGTDTFNAGSINILYE